MKPVLSPFCSALLFGLSLFISPVPGRAETITLDYCLDKVAREYPLVRAQQEKIASVQTLLDEARRSRFFPELKLKVYAGPVPDADGHFYDGIPVDCERTSCFVGEEDVELSTWEKLQNLGPFFQTELRAIQPLYTFGGINSLIQAARAGVDAEKHLLTREQMEVRKYLIKAYLGYQLAHEVLEVQQDLQGELTKVKEKVDEWLASGSSRATQTDRLRLKVFTALLEKEILTSQKGINQAQIAFLELCQENRPQNEIAIHPLSDATPPLPERKEFLHSALNSRPEIKALESAVLARQAQTARERSQNYPQIFIAGGLGYGYAPGRTPQENVFIDDEFNYLEAGIVLGLEQKLSFHTTRTHLNRSRAEHQRLQYQLQALESAVVIDVNKNYEDVRESILRIHKIREGMKSARSWMYAALENYYLGLGDISEVIDAFGAYLAIKWQLLAGIFDYQKDLMELEISAGNIPSISVSAADENPD